LVKQAGDEWRVCRNGPKGKRNKEEKKKKRTEKGWTGCRVPRASSTMGEKKG